MDGLVTVEVKLRAVIRIPRNINFRLKQGNDATFQLWETDLGNRLGGQAVVDEVNEVIALAVGQRNHAQGERTNETPVENLGDVTRETLAEHLADRVVEMTIAGRRGQQKRRKK